MYNNELLLLTQQLNRSRDSVGHLGQQSFYDKHHTLTWWCNSIVRAMIKACGEEGNLTPLPPKNPQPIVTKICKRDYVGNRYHTHTHNRLMAAGLGLPG